MTKYNQKKIPGFTDRLFRYQDEQGLWRVAEVDFDGDVDELTEDEIGNYLDHPKYGKVYVTYKPKPKQQRRGKYVDVDALLKQAKKTITEKDKKLIEK